MKYKFTITSGNLTMVGITDSLAMINVLANRLEEFDMEMYTIKED